MMGAEPRKTIWERGAIWVIGQFILLGLIVIVPPQLFGIPLLPEGWRSWSLIVGLGLVGCGMLIALAGLRSLGRNLTPLPYPIDDGQMVAHGIYRLVRHPIYSGLLLAACGYALVRASLISLVFTAILALWFDQKAAREEQWLLQKYPDYHNYRRHVRKLIPWIY